VSIINKEAAVSEANRLWKTAANLLLHDLRRWSKGRCCFYGRKWVTTDQARSLAQVVFAVRGWTKNKGITKCEFSNPNGREECFIKVVLKNNVYGSCSKKLYRIDVLTYFYKISRAWRINLISVKILTVVICIKRIIVPSADLIIANN
jgi:hypothetical protein